MSLKKKLITHMNDLEIHLEKHNIFICICENVAEKY